MQHICITGRGEKVVLTAALTHVCVLVRVMTIMAAMTLFLSWIFKSHKNEVMQPKK